MVVEHGRPMVQGFRCTLVKAHNMGCLLATAWDYWDLGLHGYVTGGSMRSNSSRHIITTCHFYTMMPVLSIPYTQYGKK